MSKNLKSSIVGASVAIVLFVALGGMRVKASGDDGAYRQLGVYSEVLSRIQTEYVEEPNIPNVTTGALHGLLESLDSNSSYLSPEEYKHYKQLKTGSGANCGVTLSKRYGYGIVVAVVPGGPADKAGLLSGDVIEAIDGRSTRDISAEELRALSYGERGSNLTLSIVRPGKAQPQKFVITRDDVRYPDASEKMLESNIGYIKPGEFNKGASQQIAEKIKAAEKSGAKKLILDLRNVSEGDISEGVATANLFLDHGLITELKGQKYKTEDFNADPRNDITKLPLVVLIDKGTAGAAEIVAAAVLENNRGDVVGDKSYGNASIQKLFNDPDGSAIFLSIAKYYSPSGKAIQDSAVTPNILVNDESDAELAAEEQGVETPEQNEKPANKPDEQLDRAIQVLKNKTS